MKKINFDDYRHPSVRVLSGRPKGNKARKEKNLDKSDETLEEINVYVPDRLVVTSSFFLGLLGDSIRAYGRENFFKKFKFEGKDISHVVEHCVNEALKEKSSLQ